MKVQCGNCKKYFDPAKHGDFCPHCGMFINEEFNAGKTTKKQWGKSEKEILGAETVEKKKRDWILYVGAVAVVIVFGFLVMPISRWIVNYSFVKSSTGVKELQYCEIEEPIEIAGHQLRISGYEWKTDNGIVPVPDGFDLLTVDYEAENTVNEKVTLDALSHIYLYCDGQYIKAEYLTPGYDDSIEDSNGTFGFMVPEEAESMELRIQIQSDTLKWKSKLAGNYAIPIEG